MAYYTDYTTVAPYVSSVGTTNSAVSNAVADILVAHAGASLVGYANTGANSSSSNYSEILLNGIYYRFYSNSTSTLGGSMLCYMSYTSGGSTMGTGNYYSFSYISGTSVTVTLRLYNLLYGVLATAGSTKMFFNIPCTPYNNTTYYVGCGYLGNGGNVCVNDGIGEEYELPSGSSIGPSYQGSIQVLTQVTFGPSTQFTTRPYLLKGVYGAYSMIYSGIVLVNSRCFYISSPFAFELNP